MEEKLRNRGKGQRIKFAFHTILLFIWIISPALYAQENPTEESAAAVLERTLNEKGIEAARIKLIWLKIKKDTYFFLEEEFIALGHRVLTLTDTGELVLFEADPQSCRILGRVQVAAMNWCNPAYADGVVYLRDGLRKDGRWKAVRVAATRTP